MQFDKIIRYILTHTNLVPIFPMNSQRLTNFVYELEFVPKIVALQNILFLPSFSFFPPRVKRGGMCQDNKSWHGCP